MTYTPILADPERPTFQAYGTTQIDSGTPSHLYFSAIFADPDAADRVAASFPKSMRVKSIGFAWDDKFGGIVRLTVVLGAAKGNPENEAGLRRARAFARRVTWDHAAPRFENQMDAAAFEELIGENVEEGR